MLRIALCDDDEKQLNQAAALLNTYLQPRPHLHGQVETYRSGGALLARAENAGGFDLYILDILMPELDGINTGRRLRALGDGGEIIYLTSANDFAADSYDVQAFSYLLKPVEQGKFFQVLDQAVKKLKQRRSSAIVVTTADGPRRILLEHIRYVERMTQILPIDNVLVHDDWGHQNGPFFSRDVCREMIVPYLKRLVEFCHSKGLTFELHSCGRTESLVPCMIEAGVDLWAGQTAINDMEGLAEQYKDQPILFELAAPAVPEGAGEREIREIARDFVLRHRDHRVGVLKRGASQACLDAIYEYSRRLYSGETL